MKKEMKKIVGIIAIVILIAVAIAIIFKSNISKNKITKIGVGDSGKDTSVGKDIKALEESQNNKIKIGNNDSNTNREKDYYDDAFVLDIYNDPRAVIQVKLESIDGNYTDESGNKWKFDSGFFSNNIGDGYYCTNGNILKLVYDSDEEIEYIVEDIVNTDVYMHEKSNNKKTTLKYIGYSEEELAEISQNEIYLTKKDEEQQEYNDKAYEAYEIANRVARIYDIIKADIDIDASNKEKSIEEFKNDLGEEEFSKYCLNKYIEKNQIELNAEELYEITGISYYETINMSEQQFKLLNETAESCKERGINFNDINESDYLYSDVVRCRNNEYPVISYDDANNMIKEMGLNPKEYLSSVEYLFEEHDHDGEHSEEHDTGNNDEQNNNQLEDGVTEEKSLIPE